MRSRLNCFPYIPVYIQIIVSRASGAPEGLQAQITACDSFYTQESLYISKAQTEAIYVNQQHSFFLGD